MCLHVLAPIMLGLVAPFRCAEKEKGKSRWIYTCEIYRPGQVMEDLPKGPGKLQPAYLIVLVE